MKILSLIIAIMIEMAVINAHTIIDPTFIENNLEKNVTLIVPVPESLNLPEGSVVGVEFELLLSGKIKVTSISGNPELTEYVKNRIEKIATEELRVPVGEKFNYNLVFKKIA